jgi:hypothetical protein
MVFGRASIDNETGSARAITCGLDPPGTDLTNPNALPTDEAHIQNLPTGSEQSITLLGPVDLSRGGADVSFDCFQGGNTAGTGNLVFTDIQVSAIQVGALHFP